MKTKTQSTLLVGLLVLSAGCSEPPAEVQPAVQDLISEPAAATVTDAAADKVGAVTLDGVMTDIQLRYFSAVPEMATYYGVSEAVAGAGRDAQLSGFSPAAEQSRRETGAAIISSLLSVDPGTLTPREQVTHQVLLTQFSNALRPGEVVSYGAVFGDYGNWFLPYPVTQLSGPQIMIIDLLSKQQRLSSAADATAYLARMAGYGPAIDEVILKLDADRQAGVIPPAFIIDKAIEVIQDRSSGAPVDYVLVSNLRDKLASAEVAAADEFVARAQGLVSEVIFPANARLIAALGVLRGEAGDEAGIWRLPQGAALYRAMITHMTDTRLDPKMIHAIGLAEVERITEEMDALLRAEGYIEGSVGARMTALGGEPQFLYPNTEQGKARVLADLEAQLAEIAPLLPAWFGTLPQAPLVVKAVPPESENSSTGGFYNNPSLDGSRPGTYWINLKDTAVWPSFSLKTLTYHEGLPGHHLQAVIGMEQRSPILQSVLYSNAFGEGWGLYAEALAKEMGLYEGDRFGDLGRLQDEIHRAIRLVVDTGIHALKWDRERAINYMVDTEGAHPDEAAGEIDRYIVWPGQALGYKIGMLRIQALRTEAQAALVERFDIRAFHDEVLRNDAVPLAVLSAKVERWVDSQRGQQE